MSTCISCNSYYRLDQFHNDPYNCQDCTAVILDDEDIYDESTLIDINSLINPSAKVKPIYNEQDLNDREF